MRVFKTLGFAFVMLFFVSPPSYGGNWNSGAKSASSSGDVATLMSYWKKCSTKMIDALEKWVRNDPDLLVKLMGKEFANDMQSMPQSMRLLVKQHNSPITASDRRKLLTTYDLTCDFDPNAFKTRLFRASLYSQMAEQEKLTSRLESGDPTLTYGELVPKTAEFDEAAITALLESDPRGVEKFGELAMRDMDRMRRSIQRLMANYGVK